MAWRHHFAHTRTATRPTWKLRLAVLALVVLVVAATRGIWTAPLGRSLVCPEEVAPSDILLLGTDHMNTDQRVTDFHSDSIILLRTDPSRHRLVYLSIPRDLRVSIPGHGEDKVNAAMQIGGAALAIRTVHDFTGLPVNHVLIIDFSQFEAGDHLYLQNRLLQTNGRGPTTRMMDPSPEESVMRFDVVELPSGQRDNSRIPTKFRDLPPVEWDKVKNHRLFEFDYVGGLWTINGKVADMDEPVAKIEQGSAEIWTLRNQGKNWSHPIHSHFTEYILLQVNGVPLVPVPEQLITGKQKGATVQVEVPVPKGPQTYPDLIVTGRRNQHRKYESAESLALSKRHAAPVFMGGRRRDIATLNPSDELVVYMKWTDFLGKYVMHCHNVVHEDHAMMIRWDIPSKGT